MKNTKKELNLLLILIGFLSLMTAVAYSCEAQFIFVKGEKHQIQAEEKEDVKVDSVSIQYKNKM